MAVPRWLGYVCKQCLFIGRPFEFAGIVLAYSIVIYRRHPEHCESPIFQRFSHSSSEEAEQWGE